MKIRICVCMCAFPDQYVRFMQCIYEKSLCTLTKLLKTLLIF